MGININNENNIKNEYVFEGNEKEFILLNEKLNQPFEYKVIFKDQNKTILKYKGQLLDNQYEGRGILYGDYTYDGYFINGSKNRYFRVYKNNLDGLIYKGFYKDDQYDGKGILYNEMGEKIYDGFFKEGKYEGIGIEYFQGGKLKRKMIYEKGEPLNECIGVFYDEDKIIYQGLVKDLRPEIGKNFTIYDSKRNIIYRGDLNNFEFNGKGILYYENSKNIYFDGFFDSGSYIYGILYDPEGNKIYEGEFMNNNPKTCTNIKLYELNGNIKFIGDLIEGKYQGYGKLYKNSKLLYDGNFKDGYYELNGILYVNENTKYEGIFKKGKYNGNGKLFKDKYLYYEGAFLDGKMHGKGIIFYQNKQKYFEGNFENGEMKGEGIKYYDNGSKKIEAIFANNTSYKGKYFSPDNELLYDGEINDDMPLNNENIKIYNDYTYKMYLGEIKDDIYSSFGKKYYPNYYMSEKLKITPSSIKIPFISFCAFSGKTNLINRIVYGKFKDIDKICIGAEYYKYFLEKNNINYKVEFIDSSGQISYRGVSKILSKNCNFVIFTINIYSELVIDENFIDEIKSIMDKNSIIYLVGNKIISRLNYSYVKVNRDKAKELLKKNKINKYIEVDAKSGEGIEILIKNLNFDIIAYSKKDENNN